MKNYDKSLIEVWDWKNRVYQDVKGLTTEEYVEKISKGANKTLTENNINLKVVSLKKGHPEIAS